MARAFAGSSPHTRGAPPVGVNPNGDVGIIPAYAGSTVTYTLNASSSRDHPRIRGEHYGKVYSVKWELGSSPHTRGALLLASALIQQKGIIPAYAGNTTLIWLYIIDFRDHPRIRGEHRSRVTGLRSNQGSSPHTRGAPSLARPSALVLGIIPAYAGSTRPAAGRRAGIGDHPRIRGEHVRPRVTTTTSPGSSPHTRGAQQARMNGASITGIIPAYAGSTTARAASARSLWDHPRIRGEHYAFRLHGRPCRGSSPHTRGALAEAGVGHRLTGIIPAYAGSTRQT